VILSVSPVAEGLTCLLPFHESGHLSKKSSTLVIIVSCIEPSIKALCNTHMHHTANEVRHNTLR